MRTYYEVELNESVEANNYSAGWIFLDNVRSLDNAMQTIKTHKRIMIDDKTPFPKYRIIKHGLKESRFGIEFINPDAIEP